VVTSATAASCSEATGLCDGGVSARDQIEKGSLGPRRDKLRRFNARSGVDPTQNASSPPRTGDPTTRRRSGPAGRSSISRGAPVLWATGRAVSTARRSGLEAIGAERTPENSSPSAEASAHGIVERNIELSRRTPAH